MKTIRHSVQSITGEDTDCMTEDTTVTKCLIKTDQQSFQPSLAVKSKEHPSIVDQISPQPSPQTTINIEKSNVVTTTAKTAIQIFICNPCGIRFSSLSTLDAHQTYYCSQRQKTDSESDEMTLGNDTDSRPSSSELTAKSMRSDNHYKCPQCSYSAEKKGSLNRHMRMHFTSSMSTQSSPCPTDVADPLTADKYCQSCDIRFSNLRTYEAHKTHYCSTRHVIELNPLGSLAPCNDNSSGPTVNVPAYLALPTNPVIIVPYVLVQNARALSTLPTTVGPSPATDTACIVQPDGTLQPVAQAIHRRSSRSRSDEIISSSKRAEVNGREKEKPTIVQPLDLRLNRSMVLPSRNVGEEEKENIGGDGNDKSTRDVVVVKQSMLLPYYTHEMLSKLTRKRSSPQTRQQFFFNRTQSKCDSCNIVFCKYTNYLAHKKHYCASRLSSVKVSGTDDADKTKHEPTVPDLDIIMEQDYVQSSMLDENSASPIVDRVGKVTTSDAKDPQDKVKFIVATKSTTAAVNAVIDDDRTNGLLTEGNRPSNGLGPSTSDQISMSSGFTYRQHSKTIAEQPVNGRRPMTTKQCRTCDISFNCLSTFIAHRKYYCRYSAENAIRNTVETSVTYYN